MQVTRLPGNPIITVDTDPSLHERGHCNINGPSIIRVPDWLPNRLGRYYLYFGHHQGSFIRLAYADSIHGPWKLHVPGTLQVGQTCFEHHIASPDVHVDEVNRRIVMYYHGCDYNLKPGINWWQFSCVAFSKDGLHFESNDEVLCEPYLRMFQYQGMHYGVLMPGQLVRSADGVTQFEYRQSDIAQALCHPRKFDYPKPRLNYGPRHFALLRRGDILHLFYSRIGDAPEHLLHTAMPLQDDWNTWQPGEPESILLPQMDWEGVNASHVASRGGCVHEPAWQLRDPCIFEDEDGRVYLAYSTAGEAGLAMAQLTLRMG